MDVHIRDEYWEDSARDFLSMYNSGSAQMACLLSYPRNSCYTRMLAFLQTETVNFSVIMVLKRMLCSGNIHY